ncbi:hypothetical protein PHYBOEH_002478 [Phytophthora boehmeriae]|uniref:Uncharacterized protein n=1 Tax=Phytophthora boehmeriae TaxID=109152 RepID=A0A8T1WWX1_9STRA|nr:hypothetical protein PHYBOEH_002478 [Phytophthora boehmeriae]
MNVLALIAATAAAISMPTVQGHGYITKPAAQWTQGYPSNGYGATIPSDVFGTLDNSKYGYGPPGAIKYLVGNLPTKYKTLSALIADKQELYSNEIDPECGLTAFKDSARSELPSQLEFTGFTHPGPCEVWCDDKQVLFESDCQTAFPDIPATMSYDKSLCASANRLTLYWIAVHGDPWQVYADCVWLKGGSGRGSGPSGASGASTPSTSTSDSSATTTNSTSNAATEAPSTSNTTPSTANSTPSTANTTPSTANTTPSTENSTPSTENSTPSTANTPPSTSGGSAANEADDASTANEADTTSTTSTTPTSGTSEKCARRMRN